MLTKEILRTTPAIASLPDGDLKESIIAEIAGLSKNDEDSVIDQKLAEWAQNIERDVHESSGIERGYTQEGKKEKYFDYLKRTIKELRTKSEESSNTAELDKLKRDLEDAKAALKNNTGDATLKADLEAAKKAIADEKSRIRDFEEQLQKERENSKTLVDKEAAKLNQYRTLMEFEKAKSQFRFQDEKIIPKDVQETFAKSAFEKVLANRAHEWRKAGDIERLVFLKADGTVDNNPEKGLNPYTLADLLEKELTPILDKGHRQAGAGTSGGASNGKQNIIVNLGFAKSRAEVDEIINSALADEGIAKTHKDYNARYQEAKKTVTNFDQLPIETR